MSYIEQLRATAVEIKKGHLKKLSISKAAFCDALKKVRNKNIARHYKDKAFEIIMEFEENYELTEAATITLDKITADVKEYIASKRKKEVQNG